MLLEDLFDKFLVCTPIDSGRPGMLDLLFPMDEAMSDLSSQERLCEMLADAVGLGPNLGAAIVGSLNDFRASRPILFEGDSPIAQLLRNLA